MKLTNLFLALCLAAAVLLAGLSAADNAADAKAKAAAEAKAKAERTRSIGNRHGELVKQLREAYDSNDAAKQTELLKAIFDNAFLADAPSYLPKDAENQIMNSLKRNKEMEKERFLLYYPKFVESSSGDAKADLIVKYADNAEIFKFMTEEEARNLRLTSLQVKDLSPMCQFRLKVRFNDLKGADALVPAVLAAQKDDKAKNNVLNTVINAFKEKKVFGSDYTDKYYRMWIDLADNADDKSARMGTYADFMTEYCMRPDEEIQKYRDSRFALKDLTLTGRAYCYVQDLNKINNDSEKFKAIFEKAYGEVKSDPKARAVLYRALTGFNWQRSAPLCCVELIEKYAIPDKEGNGYSTLNTYAGLVTNHVEETGKMLEKLYADAQKDLAPFQKDALEAQKAFAQADADFNAKTAVAVELNKKLQAVKDDKERAALKAEIEKANKAMNDARTISQEKRKAMNEALQVRSVVASRYNSCANALISYYNAIGARYYDTVNPFCEQKIIDIQLNTLALEQPFMNTWNTCSRIRDIISHLYAVGNIAGMNKMIDVLEKLKLTVNPKDTRLIASIEDIIFGVKRFAVLLVYKDGNYEQSVTLLKPYAESKNPQFRKEALEPYMRSLVAVGREDEAVPYLDDWIKSQPWYMQSRCKEQAAQLKARVKAKVKNSTRATNNERR